MSYKSYRELEVWRSAIGLVLECYRITKTFPRNETFGLVSQLRRAVVSIAANIAEGQARQHPKEFVYYISMAYGSLAELETQLEIASRLNYVKDEEFNELMNKTSEIGRMLNGLRRSIRSLVNPHSRE